MDEFTGSDLRVRRAFRVWFEFGLGSDGFEIKFVDNLGINSGPVRSL